MKSQYEIERVMRLPFLHHPQMSEMTRQLAADPRVAFEGAVEILCREMKRLGVTELDLEMCKPGVQVSPGFAPSSVSLQDDFKAGIERHIRQIYGAQREQVR